MICIYSENEDVGTVTFFLKNTFNLPPKITGYGCCASSADGGEIFFLLISPIWLN